MGNSSFKAKKGMNRLIVLGLLGVAVGLAIAVLVVALSPSSPIIGPLSGYEPKIKLSGTPNELVPFELVDQNGRRFSLDQVRGKPVFIYFGYTNCPDICPMVLQKYKKTMERLGGDADKFAFLFVSVDPWRDSPEVLKRYINAYFDSRIVALSGTEEQIAKVITDYKISVYYTDAKGAPVDPRTLPPDSRYFVNHFAWVLGADKNHKLVLALTPDMSEDEYYNAAKYLLSL